MAPAHPTQLLAAGFFFGFALFPGGNYLVALLLTLPLVLAFAYAFGLLTRLMPRTGGDYILAGRVLHRRGASYPRSPTSSRCSSPWRSSPSSWLTSASDRA